MLRLRNPKGSLFTVPTEMRFVEILSSDGRLAAVVWQDDGDVVHVSQAGEPECENYARAFGVTTARVVPVPMPDHPTRNTP